MKKNAFERGYEDGFHLLEPNKASPSQREYNDGFLHGLNDAANRIGLRFQQMERIVNDLNEAKPDEVIDVVATPTEESQ